MTSTEHTQEADLEEAISSEDLHEIHSLLKRALSHFGPGKLAAKSRRTGRASALANLDAVMKFTDEDWEMILAFCPDYAKRLKAVLKIVETTAPPIDHIAEGIKATEFKVGEQLPRIERQPDSMWICYCPDMYAISAYKAEAIAEWKRLGGRERLYEDPEPSLTIHGYDKPGGALVKKGEALVQEGKTLGVCKELRFMQVPSQNPPLHHWIHVDADGTVTASRTRWMYPSATKDAAGPLDLSRANVLSGRDGVIVIGNVAGEVDLADLLTMLNWTGPKIAIDWNAVNNEIKSFVEDYEFDTGEGYYKLGPGERIMLEDAIHGILDGDSLLKHLQRPNHMDKVMQFLDVAAGEGLVLGGVDAGDLFTLLFPEEYKRRCQTEVPGESMQSIAKVES